MRDLLNSCLATTRGALIATCLLAASPAAAQIVPDVTVLPALAVDTQPVDIRPIDTRSIEGRHRSVYAEVFTRVAKDPTTYALPPIIYTAHRLDWDSSYQLFAHGYIEANPDFTVTGRVNDVPISYAAGKQRILRYSVAMVGRSALNNGICALVERRLIERSPQRRTLIRTLGWIERGAITSYWAYRMSHNQFGQWQKNERMLAACRRPWQRRPPSRDGGPLAPQARHAARGFMAGGPIMRKHGLGPAGHRPSPRRRHRRGDRGRARLGPGHAAGPRRRRPDASRTPAAVGWPAPVRRAPRLSAGGVQRPPRRLGAARGLAGPADHDASGAPAGVRRHVELRGSSVVERPRLPRHVGVVVDADDLPGPPGRHRGRAGRDARPRRRPPRLALLLQRRARRDSRRDTDRRAGAARSVRTDPGEGAGPPATAGTCGTTRRPSDQRLRAWRRARRHGVLLRRPAG